MSPTEDVILGITLIMTVINTLVLIGVAIVVTDMGNRMFGKSDPTRR